MTTDRMAHSLTILLAGLATIALGGCASSSRSDGSPATPTTMIVDAACGECMFSMPGDGCNLAVRVDGQPYFVDGTGIDDHGDAHAHDPTATRAGNRCG